MSYIYIEDWHLSIQQQQQQEVEKAKRDKPASNDNTSLYSLHDFEINIELDLPIASEYNVLIYYIYLLKKRQIIWVCLVYTHTYYIAHMWRFEYTFFLSSFCRGDSQILKMQLKISRLLWSLYKSKLGLQQNNYILYIIECYNILYPPHNITFFLNYLTFCVECQ